MKRKLPFLIAIAFLFQTCATYKYQIAKDRLNWENEKPDPNLAIKHTMFLLGDAGGTPDGSDMFRFYKSKLDQAGENSSAVFLGDNIYPVGLPKKKNKEARAAAEKRIIAQMDLLENFKGKPFFIPGNHDWEGDGLKAVRRQERFVEKYLDRGNVWLPDDGCGGPELIELNEDLALVIMDSEWWLQDWDKEPEINDGCEFKSREAFAFGFEELVKKYKNKNCVIAMHHPPYSNGPHAGQYSLKQHLFPLTDASHDLYIPLPIIGSFFQFLRSTIGSRQDIANPLYKRLRTKVLNSVNKNGEYIFVSGHEHSMGYNMVDNQHFIVSGSGSKESVTKLKENTDFCYAKKGFSIIDFYVDGSAWMSFWVWDDEQGKGKEVYRKKIKNKFEISEENIPEVFPEYEKKQKVVNTDLLNEPVKKRGGLYQMVLGKHYREMYQLKYDLPVLDLSTYRGGLVGIKRGGGYQTNSVRLQAENGQQYVMRALTKDAKRFIPYPFNKVTALESVVKDYYLSTHPFAATLVPPLADAAGVFHANPTVYYIPKQPALGVFNDNFGDEVYLVEERAAKDWQELASFGNSDDIVSTPEVLEKTQKNHKHKVDTRHVIRSRLFDLMIGDWDRHDDQWRWATSKNEDGIKIYKPIPRDRDQPFSKYDGFVSWFARLTLPFARQLKIYSKDIGNIKWSSYNGRHFDKTFLSEASWDMYEEIAKDMQQRITDDVIDKAFNAWPEKAAEIDAAEIKEIIKYRRDDLLNIARKHYENVSKWAEVKGTNKRDFFQVERRSNEETYVAVFEYSKKGKKKTKIFERVFKNKDTKEIQLYGLNGKDKFHITGKVGRGPIIRAIGGLDDDTFIDESKVSGWSKKTKIYDSVEGNSIVLGDEGVDKTSDIRNLNIYNRREYHYEHDFSMFFPKLGWNQDNGLLLGATSTLYDYKFKKAPYGAVHNFSGTYSVATRGFELGYKGEFIQAVGAWDLVLNGNYKSDLYTINFFGLGNETTNIHFTRDDDLDFNRVRQSYWGFEPALQKRFGQDNGRFTLSSFVERIEVEETTDRFVTDPASGLVSDNLRGIVYGGFSSNFDFQSLDNINMPTRGIRFNLGARWTSNLEDSDDDFFKFKTSLAFYQNLTRNRNVVLATRLGMERIWGQYEFYNAPVLGGNYNFRGVRQDRFRGNTTFYHNTDLRIKLSSTRGGIVPLTIGITGGFDYGRVWLEGEDSEKWHTSYGGGLWLAPIDFIVLNFEYFISEEQNRFRFAVGYSF